MASKFLMEHEIVCNKIFTQNSICLYYNIRTLWLGWLDICAANLFLVWPKRIIINSQKASCEYTPTRQTMDNIICIWIIVTGILSTSWHSICLYEHLFTCELLLCKEINEEYQAVEMPFFIVVYKLLLLRTLFY